MVNVWRRIVNLGIVAFSGMHPFKIGGPQYCVYHLSRELSEFNDIQLTLYLRLYKYDHSKSLPHLSNINIIPFVVRKGEEAKLPLAILKMVGHSRNVDLVHYNSPPLFADAFLMKMTKKIITLDFHGGLFTEDIFADRPFIKALVPSLRSTFRLMARSFANIIVHSQYMKEIAAGYSAPEYRIVTIPLGIDLTEFKNAKSIILKGSPSLLFVGRLELIKGCHVLLHALKYIIQDYPKLRLYIIGKGPLELYLKTLAKKLGLDGNVHFEGNVPREILLSYYKSVDLCVFPSTYDEGFGLSVLEAMAASRPVIASDVGGMKERIQSGMNGILAKPNDSKDLAAKIHLLIDDHVMSKRLKKNALNTAKMYDWRVVALKYKEIFKNALSGDH